LGRLRLNVCPYGRAVLKKMRTERHDRFPDSDAGDNGGLLPSAAGSSSPALHFHSQSGAASLLELR
jgi:hypothetical protein